MRAMTRVILWLLLALAGAGLSAGLPAAAQDRGTLDPRPLPPLANPTDPATPAKQAFGRALEPADLQARSIGFYAKGCLAGAQALPINGEAWQVMRLSRNRNWGNPSADRLSSSISPSRCRRSTAGPASWSATSRSRAAAPC